MCMTSGDSGSPQCNNVSMVDRPGSAGFSSWVSGQPFGVVTLCSLHDQNTVKALSIHLQNGFSRFCGCLSCRKLWKIPFVNRKRSLGNHNTPPTAYKNKWNQSWNKCLLDAKTKCAVVVVVVVFSTPEASGKSKSKSLHVPETKGFPATKPWATIPWLCLPKTKGEFWQPNHGCIYLKPRGFHAMKPWLHLALKPWRIPKMKTMVAFLPLKPRGIPASKP